MRLLIVEDNVQFYQDYLLRHLQGLLPMEKIEVVHAASIAEALPHLLSGEFEVISLDTELGKGGKFNIPDGELELSLDIKKAVELVPLRRSREEAGKVAKSCIVAFGMTRVGNNAFVRAGADAGFLKIQVTTLVEIIKGKMQ